VSKDVQRPMEPTAPAGSACTPLAAFMGSTSHPA
jgi:hypothetical protein